jgi:phytoene synthase
MPTLNDLEGYCGETVSALIQLSALVLAGGTDPGTADASGHAGVAYGMTSLLRAMPFHAARGQVYLPGDILIKHGAETADILAGRSTPPLIAALDELRAVARRHLIAARAGLQQAPATVRPAFLPLAFIEPMLKRMDRPGYEPFRDLIDSPQWLKQLRLWRAARRG